MKRNVQWEYSGKSRKFYFRPKSFFPKFEVENSAYATLPRQYKFNQALNSTNF